MGGRQDQAGIARVRLHQLARPFRVEQIEVALGCVFRFHELGVVADDAEQNAQRREGAIGVDMLAGEVLGHIHRHVRREPPLPLPGQRMRGVRGVDEIDVVDAGRILLGDAREDALCPRPLDADRDPRKFRLEGLSVELGHRDLHGRIEVDLAFLLRRLDQGGRDGLARRRLRQHACGHGKGGDGRARALQRVSPRDALLRHEGLPDAVRPIHHRSDSRSLPAL